MSLHEKNLFAQCTRKFPSKIKLRRLSASLWSMAYECTVCNCSKDGITIQATSLIRFLKLSWFLTCLRQQIPPPPTPQEKIFCQDSPLILMLPVHWFTVMRLRNRSLPWGLHNTPTFGTTFFLYACTITVQEPIWLVFTGIEGIYNNSTFRQCDLSGRFL